MTQQPGSSRQSVFWPSLWALLTTWSTAAAGLEVIVNPLRQVGQDGIPARCPLRPAQDSPPALSAMVRQGSALVGASGANSPWTRMGDAQAIKAAS